jgi:hypothetical protein
MALMAGMLIMSHCALALAQGGEEVTRDLHDCGYRSPAEALTAIRAAVEAGEIADPTARPLPDVRPRRAESTALRGGVVPMVTPDDLFFFEDTTRLLTTPFSDGQLFHFMADATNDVLARHGDNFDFVAFFINFAPDHQLGAAFYLGLENGVSGIGQSIFNARPSFGVAGSNVEGWVMMWNQGSWSPGSATTTQLVLGQEFEHRFGMFLNPLFGGRPLQGPDNVCGRSGHWNFRVDAQGSGMEAPEWVGSSPAQRNGSRISYNADTGGVFSLPDLYIMGYVSGAEMDLFASELRYMDTNTSCALSYFGPIFTWGSADIVATSGTRLPTSATAQKDFHTAWVMIHLPESPPTESQVDRAVDIINDWSDTWESSTLGRGTMDNTVGVPFGMTLPAETPSILQPDTPTSFTVETVNAAGAANPSTGLLHSSIDGGAFVLTPMAAGSPGSFEATIPPVPCGGIVEYFVTMNSVDGVPIRRPAAPGTNFTAFATSSASLVFDDDFESNMGWIVSNDFALSDGSWDRGFPLGGGDRGDPAADFDGSGQCFLTDRANGNTDVDDGTTTLISPLIDLSGVEDAILQYARWYTNDIGSAPGTDDWVVQISSDRTTWVDLENTRASTGWAEKTYRISDFVTLSNQVRVRFVAEDVGDGSVVEAAVDAFRITAICCDEPVVGDADGDGDSDLLDLAGLLRCFNGESMTALSASCGSFDACPVDSSVGLGDYEAFLSTFNGPE